MDRHSINAASFFEKKAQISNFQFRYERGKPVVIGEYATDSTSDVNSGPNEDQNPEHMLGSAARSDQEHDDNREDGIIDASNMQHPFSAAKNKEKEEIVQHRNYSEGIKTLRLQYGRIVEIEEERDPDDVDEDGNPSEKQPGDKKDNNDPSSTKQDSIDDGQDENFRDFNSTFKSRKALNAVISDRRPPQAIRNLKWTANILMIAMCVIAIVNYAIEVNEFNKIIDNVTLINQSDQIIAEFMNVLSKSRDIYLTNINLLQTTNTADLSAQIQTSLQSIQTLQNAIQNSNLPLSDDHSNLFNTPSIPLRDYGGVIDRKGLGQAMDQVISKAFQVSKKPASILPTDPDYYYLTYNLLNEFYIGMVSSSNFYVQELIDRTTQEGSTFLTILIVSAICLFITLLILLPVLLDVNKTREEVLSLFLDIPEKTVKSLYQKCENFISNLQVGEDDDVVSEIDEEDLAKQQEDENVHEYTPKRKKRKFKNSGKSQRKFFLQFFLGAIVIEAYFIYAYFDAQNALSAVNDIIPEMNDTAFAESFYSFVNNAERQLLIDSTFPILLSTTPVNVATDNIKAMYSLDSEIHQDHSINIDTHSTQYVDTFNRIMMLNPCPLLADAIKNTTFCQTFADGAVYQGMAVDLTRHFENLRFLLTLYTRYSAGAAWDQDASLVGPVTNVVSGSPQHNLLLIMRTNQAVEIDITQHLFIKNSFRILMASFISGLADQFDSNQTTRLIVFIFFLIALFAIYVVFWLPLISKLANDIWRTKSMLSMIPLNVISKIKNVRIYLRKFWNSRSADF